MPFPSALSAGNLTTKRGGGAFERYLIVHAPTVQLQFHPNAAASSNISGTIPYTTALSGAYTNVLLGMTVIISPTSDYAADLRNQPENCFVTYVRSAATSSVLAIGQTKYQFATTDYVTVLNDYRIFERKIRAISANDIRRDYDISYRTPKPRISGIYSQVAYASGSSATISFAPSAEVMASSGTISTWLWKVADGTITVGSSSTQNITATFPVGTRYVHLTVTDSHGVSNYLTAFIAVIPTSLNSVIHLDNQNFNITESLENGNSASFTALADGNWLDGTQAIVATQATYADGTSALTTSLVGWLKDINDNLAGDDTVGLVKQASANILGVAYYTSQIQSEGFFTELKTAPAIWGEFGRLTPYDCLWYLASEHTTLANVAALDYPSDHTDFKFTEINIPSGTVSEVLSTMAFRCLGGMPNYSPNGEIFLRTSLFYMVDNADRDAATVYASYTTDDGLSFDFSRVTDFEIKPVGQILMGCALYNTTTRIPRVYYSKAPAGDESGYLIEELDGIIMAANTSDTDARTTAGFFTANHYFAINENPVLTVSLLDGYHTLVPSAFQWHKFSLASTDTVSTAILTTDERFICTDVTIGYDDSLGRVAVKATFRKETYGGDNYLQETGYVNTNVPAAQPYTPQYEPLPFLDTGLDSDDVYDSPNNDESGDEGVQDPTLPPLQSGEAQGQSSNVIETLFVPLFANTAVFSENALVNGASYIMRITGDGNVGINEYEATWDFTQGQGGWATGAGSYGGAYTPGVGFEDVDIGGQRELGLNLDIADNVFSAFRVLGTVTYGGGNTATNTFAMYDNLGFTSITNPLGNALPYTFAGAGLPHIINHIDVGISVDNVGPLGGTGVVTGVYIAGSGGSPFVASSVISLSILSRYRGDAYYWKYSDSVGEQYPSGKGLYVNGSLPTIPSYDSGHVYEIAFTGTGATVPFQYYDPENVYTDNDNVYLKVEIIAV